MLIYKENKVYLIYTKHWFNLYFQGMKHISQYVFPEQNSKYQKTNKQNSTVNIVSISLIINLGKPISEEDLLTNVLIRGMFLLLLQIIVLLT